MTIDSPLDAVQRRTAFDHLPIILGVLLGDRRGKQILISFPDQVIEVETASFQIRMIGKQSSAVGILDQYAQWQAVDQRFVGRP